MVGCGGGGGGGDGGNAIANRKCFDDSTTQFFSFILSSFFSVKIDEIREFSQTENIRN